MEAGARSLIKRIQFSSHGVIGLALGILVQMVVDASSGKKQVHKFTMGVAFFNLLLGLALFYLVFSSPPRPGPRRYAAIKWFLHLCAIALEFLSFSLSLMMRMNTLVACLTLAAACTYVLRRLLRCKATALAADVEAYAGREEEVQQLLETCAGVMSILLGVSFGKAFFYFHNFPEVPRDARLVPSEYLIFFSSVAASLMLVKAVPRRLLPPERSVRELRALVCALVAAAVVTALVIAGYKVGPHAVALVLVPVGVALAAGCAHRWGLPFPMPACFQQDGGRGGGEPDPLSRNIVIVVMTLFAVLLSYQGKDFRAAAPSTLFDEAFVVVTAAAVVAALLWMLFTLPPVLTWAGVQAATVVLAHSALLLLLLSVLALLGVMCGW